ncbi:rod shape-determining protein RodA [Candidatus Gracilibacteria bacterium]|nr:rod shape-determining protein RodA [Candidatus Gracilibacteria bacterium]MCF7898536.1 rod shape-determining protein RodA [Candidatus Paceibacterota bacterium]
MFRRITPSLRIFDITLFSAVVCIMLAGLFTMSSFQVQDNYFWKQGLWIIISLLVFIFVSQFEYRFLKQTQIVVILYTILLSVLTLLFIIGHTSKGAESWFKIAGIAFQPSDLMKLVLIIVLAKYFSRRHIAIANIRHIIVSSVYAFIPFVLVILQPDFGSAMVLFSIWFGMVLVSGISKKHLFAVIAIGIVTFSLAWQFAFKPYQKARIMNFVYPLQDIRGTGYNAYQSTIAVGSGGLYGKGVGFGTQSRLNFLPEYKTDFIFAAFAEEWGFIGSILLLLFFGIILYKLAVYALVADSTFEALFTYGVIIWIATHIVINIGMNLGIMPVTGIPLPFMSYGGSHLLAESIALGMCVGMRRYAREGHKYHIKNEFVGLE